MKTEVVSRKTRTFPSIVVLVVLYASIIWFFFGSLGWQVALALALALPIVIFPAALIWYINIGGIYSAMRGKR